MSSTKETSVDVLVIGAGPAGLMCAFGLARAGVDSYGLAERLLKEGNQMHMAAFYGPNSEGGIELIERVPDVTAPTARYPFEVTLHQGAIEAIFLDNMKAVGVQVDRPIIPTSIQISDDPSVLEDPQSYPVRVELQHLQGETNTMEIVHAKYVVGADGAHSWVRQTLGIAMEGEHTDYVWGVIDMVPDTNFPD
ncbi:hypothetical protein MPER_12256, partial [Moniliophthora perniciosa FA553]